MLVVMEGKFVVTKTNLSDDLRDRKRKDRKFDVFAQSVHLRVLINLWMPQPKAMCSSMAA